MQLLQCDLCIIGAGVVGLALARELALNLPAGHDGKRPQILLLEQEAHVGEHSSSRNSEVIHAGLYYAPGSLKAELCLRGRELLYDYCALRQIPHRQIGKLVLAQPGEEAALEQLRQNALRCGVASADLQWLDAAQLRSREPQLSAAAALFSRRTGIIDSHALMQQLLADAEALGVLFATHTRVQRIEPQGSAGFDLLLQAGPVPEQICLRSRVVVNCAGLQALPLAYTVTGLPPHSLPEVHWVKGQYFSYQGRSPLQHLVYPLPERSGLGLGIHATLDLSGRLRFGPDTVPVQTLDYTVDVTRLAAFASAIRRYLPGLDEARLQPDYAGIRSRIHSTGAADFVIHAGIQQGLPGLLQLFGIESPGLTASMALAVRTRELIANQYC